MISFSPHVPVESLLTWAERLDDPQWIVFDCRHDLADTTAGERAYAAAHIPGTRFVHLDRDLSGPLTGTNGRHPLPDPVRFAARLAALGMAPGKQAVAYDAQGGAYAARLWWMLRWLGHERAAVLDGGWNAWTAEGRPVTVEVPVIVAGTFAAAPRAIAVDAAFVESHLDAPQMMIVDARSPDRFRGENETLDPVGGHIPGATNRFFRAPAAGSRRIRSTSSAAPRAGGAA